MTTIKLKRSTTAGSAPSASDLEVGEVAINTADGKLYVKHTDNSINTVQGDKGQKGEVGSSGSQGAKGQKGEVGASGSAGSDGQKGQKGEVGSQGSAGAKGQKGEVGNTGAAGSDGSAGQKGQKGEVGNTGASGSDGQKGQKGEVGASGSNGSTGQKGQKGQQGNFGGATFAYNFNTSTSNADPTAGKVAFNNSTVSSVTQIYIDDTDSGSTDIQSFLRTIDDSTSTIKGHVRFSNATNANDFAIFTIASISEQTGYFIVNVSYIDGSASSFSNGENLTVTFARTGDVGDKGQKGEVGASGSNGSQGQKGQKGEVGASGSAGSAGSDGDKGQKGQKGEVGSSGSDGSAGQKGQKGEVGASGSAGSQGQKGQKGEVGAQGSGGSAGQKGQKGEVGSQGSAGGTGQKGQKGEVGATGATGDPFGGGTFTGDVTFDGATAGYDIVFDRSDNALEFADNAKASFGTGGDLQLFHNGNSNISNFTGNLTIANYADDQDVIIATDTGSGFGASYYFVADGSTGEARLYHYGTEKLSTKSYGGFLSGGTWYLGSNSGLNTFRVSERLDIKHGGHTGHGTILNTQGNLTLINSSDNYDISIQTDNGSGSYTNYFVADGSSGEAQLYYYGSEKLATKSTGISVTGGIVATGEISGGSLDIDNIGINGGTITGQTGSMSLSGNVTVENGTLTVQDDVTFTGASYNVVWDKSDNALEFAQNARLRFGNSNDFQLFSNGTTGIIGITNTETLQFWNLNNSSVMAKFNPDGSNELYHNNSKKLETTSSGIQTTGTVNVNGAYTLPTSDGSANQVLTTDGSGAVTFADAGGGGADLYAANESSPSAQPSATGANAIAMGDSATAAGLRSVAINYSHAGGQDSFAVAVGNSSQFRGAQATQSLAIGNNTYVQASSGAAFGANATIGTSGASAVALGYSYANGTDSFAAVIDNNTSSYGATQQGAIAIGRQAKSTGSYSTAIGRDAFVNAGGTDAIAIGRQATASSEGSIALGYRSNANVKGSLAFANGVFGATGDAQGRTYILRAATTDATATVLTTDGNSAVSIFNGVRLDSDTVITFDGVITAMQNGAQAYAGWRVEGLIVNDGGTVSLANSAITTIQNASDWGLALTADDPNNILRITATGEASHNIRWVANIRTVEVTYA